jgi:hypothetical protein
MNDLSTSFLLQMIADIIHVYCWNTFAFYLTNPSTSPMSMDQFQHIVCQSIPSKINLTVSLNALLDELVNLGPRQRLPQYLIPGPGIIFGAVAHEKRAGCLDVLDALLAGRRRVEGIQLGKHFLALEKRGSSCPWPVYCGRAEGNEGRLSEGQRLHLRGLGVAELELEGRPFYSV